jgi:hypothetical protein
VKVYLDRNWATTDVRIYVTQPAGLGVSYLWQLKGDQWAREEIRNEVVNDDLGPTIAMPSEMLEAIVAAAHDILPPSAATDRHLKDAVAVRDRLLTLIERQPTA